MYLFINHVHYKSTCTSKSPVFGVMISLLVLCAVDRGSSPNYVKPKTIKLVFVASPQIHSIKEKEQKLVGS